MILTNPKRCGTSVPSFSTYFRAEISVMCQKTKVSVLRKRFFFTLKPRSDTPAGCLRRTPHRKCVFFLKPGCDAPAGCLRRTPHRKCVFFLKRGIDPWTFPQGLYFPPKKRLFIENQGLTPGHSRRGFLCPQKHAPRCFCVAKIMFGGNRAAEAGGTGGRSRGNRPPTPHQPIP